MTYSHSPLIPVISLFFIFIHRKKIFEKIHYSILEGSLLLIIALSLYVIGISLKGSISKNDFLTLMIASQVLTLISMFLIIYGHTGILACPFPFILLIFMIPIPSLILDPSIHFLKAGTTEMTAWFFALSGVDFLREGSYFHLPGLIVEVADECSGIRSSIALLITGFIAAHLFLPSFNKKIILLITIIPITLFKNSIRVVTLALLGSQIDKSILSGAVHKEGGKPFFLLAMGLLFLILWLLKSWKLTTKTKDDV